MVKVKICGIRSLEAAKTAVDAGAHFLGFNFVPSSKRYINPADAAKIINAVSNKAKIVGVFQNADIDYVKNLASKLCLDFVQLHGNENNAYIERVKIPVIKSIKIDDQVNKIIAYYLLLDRAKQGEGEMPNLKKAAQIAKSYAIFFAGGLNPNNVADVIRKVGPFAVDVAGGIETNGKQDLDKIKLFILRSKRALLIKNAKGES